MANIQIVAARYGTLITGDRHTIASRARAGVWPDEFIERWQFQFLAACDLGPQWRDRANWPTLFELTPEGKPIEVPHE